MSVKTEVSGLGVIANLHPEKFGTIEHIFSHIHFIGTGCGEPQYLVRSLIEYIQSHPKAFFDTELLQVWTLGVAPYADAKFNDYFRHNSFFIGNNTGGAVNKGAADYTPIFLSQSPMLLKEVKERRVPVDAALIQMSLPDEHGYMSQGISVDILKAATESPFIEETRGGCI